ncbi:MAG: nuclease-related domain-containing protein [Candidatus Altiarchaeota archaeon]
MRILKARRRSLYVWKFIQLNRSRMMIFLTIFLLATMLFVIDVKPYASLGLLMIPLSYALGLYAYRSYMAWSSGPRGEERVLEELGKLKDDYVLIRNVVIPPSRGDIDYILVGPTGIFAIETKNVGGVVSCDGDRWGRHKVGRRGRFYRLEIGNPSMQVKRSAKTLKDFILRNGSKIFGRKTPHIWVYGILIFTNEGVRLNLRNPSVEILEVESLDDFVLNRREIRISKAVVDRISEAISSLH